MRGEIAGRSAARCALAALTLAMLVAPGLAGAAEVVLRNAWMRPAAAGSAAARVYVDIESDVTVDLVGAASPIAKKVEIVRTATIGDPTTEKAVPAYPVPARTETRLAYRGDHLRFLNLTNNAFNGTPVTLTLTFKDAAGKRFEVTTNVLVRGLFAAPPDAPPSGSPAAAANPAAAGEPAAGSNPAGAGEPGAAAPAGGMPAR